MQAIALFIAAAILFILFLVLESSVRTPLMPLDLFRLRNLATVNISAIPAQRSAVSYQTAGGMHNAEATITRDPEPNT